MPVCDICNKEMRWGDGYVLTTSQVVTKEAYWELAYTHVWSHSHSMDPNGEDVAMMAQNQARQDTGWLVCESCARKFDFDRQTAREHAKQRLSDPPGSGPADEQKAALAASNAWFKLYGKRPVSVQIVEGPRSVSDSSGEWQRPSGVSGFEDDFDYEESGAKETAAPPPPPPPPPSTPKTDFSGSGRMSFGTARMSAFWGVDGTSINWKPALFLPAAWMAVGLVGQLIFAFTSSSEFMLEGILDVFVGVIPLWVAGFFVFRFKPGRRESITALMAAAVAVLLWLPLGGFVFWGKGFPVTFFINMMFFRFIVSYLFFKVLLMLFGRVKQLWLAFAAGLFIYNVAVFLISTGMFFGLDTLFSILSPYEFIGFAVNAAVLASVLYWGHVFLGGRAGSMEIPASSPETREWTTSAAPAPETAGAGSPFSGKDDVERSPASGRPAGSSFVEKDNVGTRQDTMDQAAAYWMMRNVGQKFEPYVLSEFDRMEDARRALLDLDCIHEAKDTGGLICTRTLIFGCYEREDGTYEAIVCGDDLSPELWASAKESFSRHNGRLKNEQEPEKPAAQAPETRAPEPGGVVFVREDVEERMGQDMVYRIHKGPDAASAKAFLQENPVHKRFYYIVVETPEGNYCRDIEGIYKE